jgi:hypothetical protein
MAACLLAAIERLPPRARRIVLAATAVLLLVGAITPLTFEAAPGGGARRRTPIPFGPSHRAPARPLPPPVSSPVSVTGLYAARVVAGRFLASYLQFAYGRAAAGSVNAVTPVLRRQLSQQWAQVTPGERGRHPRVVSLGMVGMAPGFVLATAIVEDGGIAAYRLRLTVEEQAGRWLVSSVQEG